MTTQQESLFDTATITAGRILTAPAPQAKPTHRAGKRYTFHVDPGHGWLAVKRSELHALGIENDISPYSYEKGDTVYLEEDCDASKFARAYMELHDEKVKHDTVYHDNGRCFIRRCRSYTPR